MLSNPSSSRIVSKYYVMGINCFIFGSHDESVREGGDATIVYVITPLVTTVAVTIAVKFAKEKSELEPTCSCSFSASEIVGD